MATTTGVLRGLTTEVRTAAIGCFVPSVLRAPTTCTSSRQTCSLRATTIAGTGLRCSSRDFGLLSAPLSYVRSGDYYWGSTELNNRGSNGYYWSLRSYNTTISLLPELLLIRLTPSESLQSRLRVCGALRVFFSPPATTASLAPHYRM